MHVCLCTICLLSELRSEEGTGPDEITLWVVGTDLGPLQEQQVLLSAEPSLQTNLVFCIVHLYFAFDSCSNHSSIFNPRLPNIQETDQVPTWSIAFAEWYQVTTDFKDLMSPF